MERRTFLSRVITVAATAATVGPMAACSDVGEVTDAFLGDPSLLSALGADAVRALGRAYMETTPDEADKDTLVAALRDDLRALRGMPWQPDPDFPSLIRADFDAERTVWLDGWLLSRNEGRRLAVFALNTAS
jgi:hypothetical protein